MANVKISNNNHFNLPEIIVEGTRNETIYQYGFHLKFKEHRTDDEIATILRETNATRCKPPMEDWEIEQTIRNAAKVLSGKPIGTGMRKNGNLVEIDEELPETEQAARQIQAMFSTIDIVCFVTDFRKKPDGKWAPTGNPIFKFARTAINELQHAKTLEDVFPGYNKEAGILICANPTLPRGRKNEDVTAFRNALIEYDDISKDEQIKRMLNSKLPISSMTDSGNKSIHAIVRIDARNESEYKRLVTQLYGALEKKFESTCDKANKNPARLTRLAGSQRGDHVQRLLYTEVNTESDIRDFLNGKSNNNYQEPEKLSFNEVGDKLITEYEACYVDGVPAIKVDGEYQTGADEVFKAVLSIKSDASRSFRSEVLSYLSLKAKQVSQASPRYIRFQNGILDLATLTLKPEGAKGIVLNKIPHKWNPDAQSPLVEEAFSKIALGDKAIIANLWEMFGLSMYRGSEVSRLILLQGAGANGKSTLLDMLRCLLGEDNCFSLGVHQLGERFQLVPAMGKLAIIGDDISSDRVNSKSCAMMKKLVTGETVNDEYKGGASFQFRFYGTLIYSCNETPLFADGSFGFERRMHPIPLSARFSPSDEGFDPYLKQKLCKEQNIEYAIVKGIRALRECLKRGAMTENGLIAASRTDMVRNNDPVRAFIADVKAEGFEFKGKANNDVYARFEDWCDRSGESLIPMGSFSKKLCSHENLTTLSSNGVRSYVARTP